MSQYYKFEYWGYLMVKLDLVYKYPFSFYFIKISNIPHAYLILPNFPTPRLFENQEYTISTKIPFKLFFLQYSQLLLCPENLRHHQTIFGPVIGLIRSNTGSKLKNDVAYQNNTCILTCALLPPYARMQSTSGSILTRQIILNE